MTSDKIRKKFLTYFKNHKQFPHTIVGSSSLWPKDDPSVLLTIAGMQQFKPYFLGIKDPKKDFESDQLVSVQKSFRTSDIEEVGDGWHNTFFEMLGNFSFGAYFKEEAIALAWNFLVQELLIDKDRLWATYFNGDSDAEKDSVAVKLWASFLPKNRIIGFGKKENWWGPPGSSGPCGPSSELHFDLSKEQCKKGDACRPNCSCGRFLEIWNLVFMQYHMTEKGTFKKLPSQNVDTGMGLERLAVILQKKKNIFDIDLFEPIIKIIKADKNLGSTNAVEDEVRSYIIADHLKGTVFLLSDGIEFSNKEQGYVLRRIFRRALDQYIHVRFDLFPAVDEIIEIYRNIYPELTEQKNLIHEKISKELDAYKKVLNTNVEEVVNKIIGLKKQTRGTEQREPSKRLITPSDAFKLYSTYGLSAERLKRQGFTFDEKEFNNEVKKHQSLSRVGAKSKFGGHGITSGELSDKDRKKMTRLHTATHLLHTALRTVLGTHVRQQGSDINPERLRFDFENDGKMTEEQKKEVEKLVNEQIDRKIPVTSEEMEYKKAIEIGALAFFKEKYPDKVTVYSIGDYSKELCGGPHVLNTSQIGKFTIVSEKSSSAGIRRIKATVE